MVRENCGLNISALTEILYMYIYIYVYKNVYIYIVSPGRALVEVNRSALLADLSPPVCMVLQQREAAFICIFCCLWRLWSPAMQMLLLWPQNVDDAVRVYPFKQLYALRVLSWI